MGKKFKILGASIVFLICSQFAEARDLNPDGSIKQYPYTPVEKKQVEDLSREIDKYHKMLNEKIGYLKYKNKVKNGKYSHEAYTRDHVDRLEHKKYSVTTKYNLNLKSSPEGGYTLDTLEFIHKNTLITRRYEPVTEVRILKNSSNSSLDLDGLSLTVITTTNSGQDTKSFNMKTIPESKERMRVAKMYRDRVLDLLRNIDRYIDSDETQQSRMVNEALLQINIGGDFQEPMK
jgi:hypothetical protein